MTHTSLTVQLTVQSSSLTQDEIEALRRGFRAGDLVMWRGSPYRVARISTLVYAAGESETTFYLQPRHWLRPALRPITPDAALDPHTPPGQA